ncbi:MAG TPA: hypothetical protein VF384_15180 [Planctomycetota bacterium]
MEAFENRLRDALVGGVRQQWAEAKAEPDQARQRELLQRLLGRLPHVQRQDYLAEIVRDCQLRLASLAEASGNLTEAVDWMRRSVAFDDHDLATQARLGNLLCRTDSTRWQGFDLLHALAARFPANPGVVPVLAANLIDAGRAEAALALLENAHRETQSNLWTVFWDTGEDFDLHRACIVPTVHDGMLRLRFDLADAKRLRRLRFLMPCFASMALVAPRLHVEAGDQVVEIDASAPPAMNQVERRSNRLEATGHLEAWFDVVLPELPAGRCKITFAASVSPRRSRLLAMPALRPGMAALRDELVRHGRLDALQQLQQWRGTACSGLPMQCFFAEAESAFDGSRLVDAAIECANDGGLEVLFHVQKPATVLRIDLPSSVAGLEFRWSTLEVVAGGRHVVLDPRTMPLLGTHQVERRNDVFVATGDDPYFWFKAPAGDRIDSVHLRGVL